MVPEDDPTWPECVHGTSHWCEFAQGKIEQHEDSADLALGIRICVPMFPNEVLYAEAAIDSEPIGNSDSAILYLVRDSIISEDEELIPMGIWSPGEGRLIARYTFWDWAKSLNLACNYFDHGYKEELALTSMSNVNIWCLAYYKKCFLCYQKSNKNVINFNASTFGLGEELNQLNFAVNSYAKDGLAKLRTQLYGNNSGL